MMGFPPAFPNRFQTMPSGELPPFYALHNDSHPQNLMRNTTFLSWSQGNTVRPDCWEWLANNGTLLKETTAADRQWGNYSCRISKSNTDADISRLYQNMEKLGVNALMDQYYYTFSTRLKSDTASYARVFYYDGTSYTYSAYHSGGSAWETMVLSFEHTNGATDFYVGIECAVPGGLSKMCYCDCAMLTKGLIPHTWEENSADRSIVCQDWDEDGKDHRLSGCVRLIPFEVSGSTTGGALSEVASSMVLLYGCRQIMDVSLNMYSFAALPERHILWANNFSTTGFDIHIGRTDGRAIAAAQAWTITGHILAIGWDAPFEQYKTV